MGHTDIVTAADLFSEERLVRHIQRHYPDHGVIGEEGALIPSQSGYTWRFDPIDGTVPYSNGSDCFGISAGLEKDGVPIFGIIHYPALHDTLAAARGKGCSVPAKWERPPAETLKEASVVADIQVGKEHFYGLVRSRVKLVQIFGSVVYDVRELVRGKIDAMFHTGATPFDIAAGIVIVREAGCTVSGILTDELDLTQPKIPIIMSRSERLRDELRELLAPVLS